MPYLLRLKTQFPIKVYAVTRFDALAASYLEQEAKPSHVPTNSHAWKTISKNLGEPCLVLRFDQLPKDVQNTEDVDKLLPRADKEQMIQKLKRRVSSVFKEKAGQKGEDKKDENLRIVAWEVHASVVEALDRADFKEVLPVRNNIRRSMDGYQWEKSSN